MWHLPCYADDATFVISSDTRQQNQTKLTRNLATISTFLNNNYLTINATKTTICETMVYQKHTRITGPPPQLTVKAPNGENKIINATEHIRLLGMNINQNLSWNSHLISGERAVIPYLKEQTRST